MYFLLRMMIFHCYVGLLEGNCRGFMVFNGSIHWSILATEKRRSLAPHRTTEMIYLPRSPIHRGHVGMSKLRVQRGCCLDMFNYTGGFQIFLIFIPYPGEMTIQFGEHIFQMGWNHQLVQLLLFPACLKEDNVLFCRFCWVANHWSIRRLVLDGRKWKWSSFLCLQNGKMRRCFGFQIFRYLPWWVL